MREKVSGARRFGSIQVRNESFHASSCRLMRYFLQPVRVILSMLVQSNFMEPLLPALSKGYGASS